MNTKIIKKRGPLSTQLSDYYHLFLVKIAKMPQERAMTEEEEARMVKLFSKINSLKREIENA